MVKLISLGFAQSGPNLSQWGVRMMKKRVSAAGAAGRSTSPPRLVAWSNSSDGEKEVDSDLELGSNTQQPHRLS